MYTCAHGVRGEETILSGLNPFTMHCVHRNIPILKLLLDMYLKLLIVESIFLKVVLPVECTHVINFAAK